MVALSSVSPSLAPATNYDRINAAIAEAAKVSDLANAVAGKVDANQLGGIKPIFRASGTLVQAKAAADAAWTTLFDYGQLVGPAGLNPEIGIDPANGTSLRWRLAGGTWNPLFDLAQLKGADGLDGQDGRDGGLYSFERPGVGPFYFTPETAVREPTAYSDLDPARIVATSEGRAYRFSGQGWLVSRQFWPVAPDETYRAVAAWIRSVAPADPSGDTLRFGLLCYDANRAQIRDFVLKDWTAAPTGVRQSFTGFFSRLDSGIAGVQVLPAATRTVRPYVRAFGGTQATDVEILAWNNGGSDGASGGPGGSTGEAAAYAAQARGYRDEAGSIRTDTASIKADVQAIAADAAKAAPGYATLAQLNADLAWPEGSTKQVLADSLNNGTYRKSGPSGSGGWVKVSDATVPGLEAATRDAREAIRSVNGGTFTIGDEAGFVALILDALGVDHSVFGMREGRVLATDDGLAVADAAGFVTALLGAAGLHLGGGALRSYDPTAYPATDPSSWFAAQGLLVSDEHGFIHAALNSMGLHLEGVSFGSYAGAALVLSDPQGWVGAVFGLDGTLSAVGLGTGGASGNYSAAEMAERNARSLGLSSAIRDGSNPQIAAPVWGYTHLLVYGQSLGVGAEAWPAKSVSSRPDVLMFGDAVRSQRQDTTTYTPAGGNAVLKPLRAVVQSPTSGAVLTDAQVAALTPGSAAAGESPAEGAVRIARRLYLQHRGVDFDPDRLWVASNAASGGKSVEELSKGADPNLFNRIPDVATQVKGLASAAGKTYGVGAIFYLQGENNYGAVRGATTDKAAYKTLLGKLYDDVVADVAVGIAGQSDPPAMITYQTSGTWATDGVAIGQAQYELSLERAGWYLAAPAYPVTDKGGHLDANGSRWLGLQMGKVFHEVAVRRRGWRPLSPLQTTFRGATVLVDFHVPYPPLQFRPVYVASTATDYATKGFSVSDASGAAEITSVAIVKDALVRITCARPLVAPVTVFYGQRTGVAGNGNLCDSDPTRSSELYEYTAGSGDYAEANIPELVGKPYPLWNWCVAFSVAATAD